MKGRLQLAQQVPWRRVFTPVGSQFVVDERVLDIAQRDRERSDDPGFLLEFRALSAQVLNSGVGVLSRFITLGFEICVFSTKV
jgi:hypothetical protein